MPGDTEIFRKLNQSQGSFMCNVIDAFLNDTMAKLNTEAEGERQSQVAINAEIRKEN